MTEEHKNQIQKFLLDLVDNPASLQELKENPRSFIAKSSLSSQHKKLFTGNDHVMIKNAISEAFNKPDPEIGIQVTSTFQIIFGASSRKARVSLGQRTSGPQSLDVAAIQVTHVNEP